MMHARCVDAHDSDSQPVYPMNNLILRPLTSSSSLRCSWQIFITCTAILLNSGCSTSLFQAPVEVLKSPVALLSSMRAQKTIGRILCLWEPSEGLGVDGLPSRGFAGQILFFGHGGATPVPVKGTVRIMEYVNYDPDEIDPTPNHIFTFDDGAWNAHRSKGTLGEAYNVFLPLTDDPRTHVLCALRVEFTDEDGRMVSSPYTEVTLPGRAGRSATNVKRADHAADTSAKSTNVDPVSPASTTKLESTTIALPQRR